MTLVEILRYPSRPATSTGDGHHQSDKKAAREAPGRHGGDAHGAAEAPQAFRELVVEELRHGDIHEHLRRSDQQVLRDLPEDAESAGRVDADADASCGAHQPLLLHHAGGDHGGGGDDEPRPHPLELRRLVRYLGHDLDDAEAVDEDEGRDAQYLEDVHAGGRDGELPQGVVHGLRLLDEHRRHLRVGRGEEDAAEPDWD